MKYLTTYKLFESKFVTRDEVDELLDKISDSGITSLSDIERKRLTIFSEDDKDIINLIEQMADVTLKFVELNRKLNDKMDIKGYENMLEGWRKEWGPLNKEMSRLENILRGYGIELGDERLTLLMKKQRPDAYNRHLFEKLSKKYKRALKRSRRRRKNRSKIKLATSDDKPFSFNSVASSAIPGPQAVKSIQIS